MLIEKNLYSVIDQNSEDGKLNVTLKVDADNEIFQGHFPEIPILPGVCMLQMVREMLEASLSRKFRVQEVTNMKFMVAFNPTEQNVVTMKIAYSQQESTYKVNATFSSPEVVFFKLNAIFS